MNTTRRAGAVFTILALAGTAACSRTAPSAPLPRPERADGPYHLSEQFKDLRFVWTAEPDVDLVRGPMVPVRAYIETSTLTLYSSKPSDAYPGFDKAVPQNGKFGQSPDETQNLRLKSPTGAAAQTQRTRAQGGVAHEVVLSLSPTRDGGWAAVICGGGYSLSTRLQDGKWAATDGVSDKPVHTDPSQVPPPAGWGGVTRVEVRQNPQPGPNTQTSDGGGPAQAGPLPAPQADVFGNWRIVGVLDNYGAADGATGQRWSDGSWEGQDWKRAQGQCMAKAPDPEEVRARWLAGEHDGPYPSPEPLPAPVPGWPAAKDG
ncbi:hypothetical protein Srot_0792 [Segniliparus rotundus DSM 44985]|uniref:Lipoprotein n=1 Tax=Segniliparus rotundus (strain ATCC BAA-972 / CDC 1076 / CIP 108378 / DSM 44985 / JCM 13578) TaxID=640132 RepID=D6ZDZ1_SEGRD|nr:hypothetical protein [Segniliparus rotundus]ADG97271.1 hypothetical protein Srot_0792 [Segniliparus rotundus DSM 44985]